MSAIWWQGDEIGPTGASTGADSALCGMPGRGCGDRAGIAAKAVSMIEPSYTYRAEIVNVVDGDTVDVLWDHGGDIVRKVRLRLWGINAPEMRGESAEQGREARIRLRDLCFLAGNQVVMRTHKDRKDSFGRYLAELCVPGSPRTINQQMVDEGHAVEYMAK